MSRASRFIAKRNKNSQHIVDDPNIPDLEKAVILFDEYMWTDKDLIKKFNLSEDEFWDAVVVHARKTHKKKKDGSNDCFCELCYDM